MSHIINFVLCVREKEASSCVVVLALFQFRRAISITFARLREWQQQVKHKQNENTHTYTLLVCLPYLAFTLSLSLSLSVDIFTLWATVGWCKFLKCKLFVHTNTHVYIRNCSAYVARMCVCQCEYVHNWFCYGSVANRLISGPLRIEICTALSAILFQNLHLSIKTDA